MKLPGRKRKELQDIIKANGIELKWLAQQCGLSYMTLWRQLEEAKDMRLEVYDLIVETLRKHGFLVSNTEQIEHLKSDFLSITSIVEGGMSLLVKSFQSKIADGNLNEKEVKELSDSLENFRNKINNSLDDISMGIILKVK